MEDGEIVALYWQRSEQAIAETQRKYGGYCYSIAKNILWSAEDWRKRSAIPTSAHGTPCRRRGPSSCGPSSERSRGGWR